MKYKSPLSQYFLGLGTRQELHCIKVKHLLNPNSGKFVTYQELIKLFKVKSSITVYYGLLSAKNKLQQHQPLSLALLVAEYLIY